MGKTAPVILIILMISVSLSCAGLTKTDPVSGYEAEKNRISVEDFTEAERDTESGADTRTENVPNPAAGSYSGGLIAAEPEAAGSGEEKDNPARPASLPLSDYELLAETAEKMPWNMIGVIDGKRPLIIIHDLDKNGYNDAIVLAIEGDKKTDATVRNLSNSARLFESEKEYFNYFLLIFYQSPDDVVLRYTVPASRQLVFNGMKPVEIRPGYDFPYSVSLEFRTRSGIEEKLIILSGYGITGFTIRQNLSVITLFEDIDDDGYLDIVVHEQGFEEGTGFETFLTWYKWNLREYTEYKNTNIVRNLRDFFIVCSEYLRAGEYDRFLDYAVDPGVFTDMKKQGLTDEDIMRRIFEPADEGSFPEEDFFTPGGFSAVVFPEIMETPFSYETRKDFRHTVSVRFSVRGNGSRIFLAKLNMKKNPFQKKQFCFCIDN